MPNRPWLRTTARSIGVLGAIAVIAIVVFVALAVYSAAQLRPATGTGTQPSIAPGANNSVVVHANVSVDNPGYFSLDGLQINTQVRLPGANGSILASGSSPVLSIASGTNGSVPLELIVPISGSADATLLTHDLVLPGWAWVNATYARVFSIELTIPRNISWGAPFANLVVQSGTPMLLPNGTTEEPLNISFSDDSGYPITGTIHYAVQTPGGAECTGGSLPIQVNAHTPFRSSSTVYVPPGCTSAGNTLVVSYSGGPWNVVLLREGFG